MGSSSDRAVAEKCIAVLKEFEVSYQLRIASAHRTPEKLNEIVSGSESEVFVAIAGLSAALPGAIASHTTKPVVGVPVDSKLDGLDALLSIAQMPPGIPVACVGIDRGENAALLAIEILALKHEELQRKLTDYRKKLKEKVEKEDEELRKVGPLSITEKTKERLEKDEEKLNKGVG
ncbi:5-(carboxyamino)imidazole ribonucleotide mutase [Candidatus Micrarchaeota archaeon]|nr:5-(carboxyamino)imidazole ribonucleotide mutase [Candidatus Micrarchaeota archaeon]